ncbi:MAG: hypothetical protein K2K36_06885, partial [Muribaculaceae bacterium]|nr:hypothetical protein [Muribaculaceae bacterium]
PVLGQVAVRNCTDAGIFSIKNEGFGLESNGTDIIINDKQAGIEDVVVNSNVPARYYNLSGFEVKADALTSGTYIVVKGNKTSKIQIR